MRWFTQSCIGGVNALNLIIDPITSGIIMCFIHCATFIKKVSPVTRLTERVWEREIFRMWKTIVEWIGKWESLGVHAFSCLFIIYFGRWIHIVHFGTIKSFNPVRCQAHWHVPPKTDSIRKYLTINSQFYKSRYQHNYRIYSNIQCRSSPFYSMLHTVRKTIFFPSKTKTGPSYVNKLVFRSVFLALNTPERFLTCLSHFVNLRTVCPMTLPTEQLSSCYLLQ